MRDGFAKLKIDWRKKSDEKIQSLEKIVKELSKQVKQQALYQERTEKFELIVREQEKTISKLKVERMHIKKVGTVNRNICPCSNRR